MKYLYLLLLTLPLLTRSYPTEADEKTISLDDVTVDSDLAASDKDSQLQKRSGGGSADYALHLKQGFLSSLGHASASIASGSSGGSSGGGYGYKSYGGDGHHGNSVEYNPWSLKKTVLNTIFQAVKAITGGVTALKGQLIKGSGYALSASGQVVAASGDKVTDVGKYIINSAQSKLQPIPSGGGGGHPFGKFASLSGASSGGSSSSGGVKHPSGPVVHTESITSYEIPSGHSSYGPPSKPPTFSSATHQYLPPSGSGGYTGGGAGYGGGHVAFEAPSSNYLPTAYGPDASTGQEFNIYGRHHKLTDEEARKAAVQLQEILNMLPNGKTEYTASKTVTLDTSNSGGYSTGYGTGEGVDLNSYGLPNDLGPLESLSHTEQITAAYGTKNPYDLYHQMRKQKQTPEEVYIEKHPNEGYDYKPAYKPENPNTYKYDNYHASAGGSNKDSLKDLTPIIAALEVAQKQQPAKTQVSYAVEKNVHKIPAPKHGPAQFLPPAVQKTKYIYYQPTPSKYEYHTQYNTRPVYNGPYKVKRSAVDTAPILPRHKMSIFSAPDFENQDTLLYNPMLLLPINSTIIFMQKSFINYYLNLLLYSLNFLLGISKLTYKYATIFQNFTTLRKHSKFCFYHFLSWCFIFIIFYYNCSIHFQVHCL
ncbi:hypothetical protein CVS40_0342 [Lucilia cuprina]|nr:hypothetical protein CVS40_0342 [Lucilia cuprina]